LIDIALVRNSLTLSGKCPRTARIACSAAMALRLSIASTMSLTDISVCEKSLKYAAWCVKQKIWHLEMKRR
jgi:hypothetical protein